TAKGLLNPILDGLTGALAGPLGEAVDALAQLNVNKQTNHPDGSFTQTALEVGLLPAGSAVSVQLANATVGPNDTYEGPGDDQAAADADDQADAADDADASDDAEVDGAVDADADDAADGA